MVISVTALVFTVMLGGLAVLVGIFSLAFLDHRTHSSADGAVAAVIVTLAVSGLLGIVGFTATAVRLARRRIAWPFSVGTLVVCMLTLMTGALWFASTVGA